MTHTLILALFPGLPALVSLYGLVFDPSQIEKEIGAVSGVLPLGGVVLLLTWLYLSTLVVLFGAAIKYAIREANPPGFH